ncbi:procollagen galactosyltransferase 1-like [Hoplias malabaricus]|uniref:procollagen galactosyltransferase 1-like n=1 Tax=Hoplias malabaricus TaxID=27720 RepID=UPI003461BE66
MPRLSTLLVAASWLLFAGWVCGYFTEERWSPESPLLAPRVVVALICRNSEHSLPYVLGAIDRFNFPKNRMALCLPFWRNRQRDGETDRLTKTQTELEG